MRQGDGESVEHIKRREYTEPKSSQVCEEHFVQGPEPLARRHVRYGEYTAPVSTFASRIVRHPTRGHTQNRAGAVVKAALRRRGIVSCTTWVTGPAIIVTAIGLRPVMAAWSTEGAPLDRGPWRLRTRRGVRVGRVEDDRGAVDRCGPHAVGTIVLGGLATFAAILLSRPASSGGWDNQTFVGPTESLLDNGTCYAHGGVRRTCVLECSDGG